MNCRHTQNQFDDRLDGRLDERQVREFDAHVAGCAACRAAWRQSAALWQTLALDRGIAPSTGFTERTLRRLTEAVEPVRMPVWRLPLVRWATVAGLAVIVIVMGAVGVHRSREGRAEVYVQAHQDQLEDFDVIAALDQLNVKPGRSL